MEHFKKLMEKKRAEGKGHMDETESAAHGSVLHDMINALDQDGMDKVKGLKKVTVAAPDTGSLKTGLDKAKEIVSEGEKEVHGGDEHDDNLLKHESEESPEYDDEESEEAEEDSPAKHVDEAEAHDPMSMHNPSNEEGMQEHNMVEGSPEHVAHLKKQLEDHKAEIAHLRAPKSYY